MFGDAIGCHTELPFRFKVLDETPIRSKPLPYPKVAREWVKTYVEKQKELGVLREVIRGRDEEPVFVCNVVLVQEG